MKPKSQTPRSYKLEELLPLIQSMVKTVLTYSTDLKGCFAEEHPWSAVYMGYFPASDIFLRLASHPDHTLEVVDIPEKEIRERLKKQAGVVIRYRLTAPGDGKVTVFSFVSDSNGNFIFEEGPEE